MTCQISKRCNGGFTGPLPQGFPSDGMSAHAGHKGRTGIHAVAGQAGPIYQVKDPEMQPPDPSHPPRTVEVTTDGGTNV